ncbi:MAG: hypothetical protein AAF678_05950 [Pseudomonadota bacterium]
MQTLCLKAGLLIALMSTGLPSYASNCADRDMIVERLKSKYHEELAAGGIQKAATTNAIVEVWASHKTGTFTVLLTRPSGVTCIMATGTDWHQMDWQSNNAGTEG